MELWVLVTIGAAALQSVRTATQKHLAATLPNHFVNFARFAYGAPLAVGVLSLWVWRSGGPLPAISIELVSWCGLIAVSQILGTWALLSAFVTRNFAVAVTFSKTESLQTALLSVLIVGEQLVLTAWLAIVLSVVGIAALTTPSNLRTLDVLARAALRRGALFGLFSGLMFGLSATAIRAASNGLGEFDFVTRSLLVLAITTSLQLLLLGSFLALRHREGFAAFGRSWRPAIAVGVTSVAGSAGWFTAMTLQKAAYVQVVGQIEIILSIIVSRLIFQERITPVELAGVALFAGGLVLLFVA